MFKIRIFCLSPLSESAPVTVNSAPPTESLRCRDPYLEPGYISYNTSTSEIDETRWRPFLEDDNCRTPRLLAQVWWLCQYLGGDKSVIQYNFSILMVFHFGMNQTPIFTDKPEHFYYPITSEERVDNILLPLLATLRGPKVDLVAISSYEWDFLERAAWGSGENDHMDLEERYALWTASMPRFIARVGELADHVLKVFPHRTNQYPILFRIPHPIIGHFRAPFLLSNLFRPATELVVKNPKYEGRIIETRIGAGLAGAGADGDDSGWYSDTVHPAPLPHAYVWADHLLFHLRRAVLGEGHEAGL
ncbi:hypothetical protein RQP46_010176 [Phenoliferia psychrophenolica]